MVSDKTIKIIKKILIRYDLGVLQNIELFDSSQNKVYKVETNKKIYVFKEFSKDAISNYYYLKKRKEQIRISKIINENGINTVIPLEYNKKNFILFNKHYYLIYDFYEERPMTSDQLTFDHIRILASTQSKLHKMNIQSNLPCSYHYININLDNQLEISKKVDKKLFDVINDNKEILKSLITNCNNTTKKMKKNLCISHNDYKLLNILWKDNELKLIDFDAMGLSNPTCALCESAYSFSKGKNAINYEFYKEYLKEYVKNYGTIKDNYKDALYASLNGKLQWLQYMFSKNHLKNNNYIADTISMVKSLVKYYNNIDKFYKIYLEVMEEK